MDDRQVDKGKIAAGLLGCLGRPWIQLMTVPGTAGVRWVGNINFLWSLGILVLFAGLGRSEWLLYAVPLTLLVQAEHWHKSKRAAGRHSYFVGEPVLARLVKTPGAAWTLTGLLAAAVGALVLDEDRALGWYLILSAVSMAAQFGMAGAKSRAVDDDVADGVLEAKLRAERSRR